MSSPSRSLCHSFGDTTLGMLAIEATSIVIYLQSPTPVGPRFLNMISTGSEAHRWAIEALLQPGGESRFVPEQWPVAVPRPILPCPTAASLDLFSELWSDRRRHSNGGSSDLAGVSR
jgi:hypothetical protein